MESQQPNRAHTTPAGHSHWLLRMVMFFHEWRRKRLGAWTISIDESTCHYVISNYYGGIIYIEAEGHVAASGTIELPIGCRNLIVITEHSHHA